MRWSDILLRSMPPLSEEDELQNTWSINVADLRERRVGKVTVGLKEKLNRSSKYSANKERVSIFSKSMLKSPTITVSRRMSNFR